MNNCRIASELLKIARELVGSVSHSPETIVAYDDTPGETKIKVFLSPEGRQFLREAIEWDKKRVGREQYEQIEQHRKKEKTKSDKMNLSDYFTSCCQALKKSPTGHFRCPNGDGKMLTDYKGLYEMSVDIGSTRYRWCYFKYNDCFIILNGFDKNNQKQKRDLNYGLSLRDKYLKEGTINCREQ